MTRRDEDDGGRKGSHAPDPLKSDLGRTDDVPDVNASGTGGATSPKKPEEPVE